MTVLNRTSLVFVADDAVWTKEIAAGPSVGHQNPKLRKSDEDDFWSFEARIRNPAGGFFRPGRLQRVFFSEEVAGVWKLRFDGRMKVPPFGTSGRMIDLQFQARPQTIRVTDSTGAFRGVRQDKDTVARKVLCNEDVTNVGGQYGNLYKPKGPVDDDPWFLFTDVRKILPFDTRKIEEILGARSAKLHWQRDGTAPVLVDIVEGNGKTIDIGARMVAGTFRFDQISNPITRVDVSITASWDQKILRSASIDQAAQTTGATVGTLSEGSWDQFPRPGDKVGDWTVIKSGIRLIPPPNGESENSAVFTLSTRQNPTTAPTTATTVMRSFSRRFYDFDLEMVGVQTIKRTEVLTFSVFWGGQQVAGFDGEAVPLDLTCGNLRFDDRYPEFMPGEFYAGGDVVRYDGILWQRRNSQQGASTSIYADIDNWQAVLVDGSPVGSPEAAIFFGAPSVITAQLSAGGFASVTRDPIPGVSAGIYGLNQAIAKMKDANRIPFTFQVPWEYVDDITGGELVSVMPADMQGKAVVGKVVSVDVDVHSGIATIGAATMPGVGLDDPEFDQPNYGTGPIPYAGIIGFEFVNDYRAQEARLASLGGTISTSFEQEMAGFSTSYRVSMTPIGGESDATLTIPLPSMTYYGPKQIDLGAEA